VNDTALRPRGLVRARTLWRLFRAEQSDPEPFYRYLAAEAAVEISRRLGRSPARRSSISGAAPGTTRGRSAIAARP